MYKSKLQELCHAKKWGLPSYSSVKTGPSHNPLVKASVSVNGETYNTSTFSKNSKLACNEAAKLAFLHITSDEDPIDGEKKIEVKDVGQEISSGNALTDIVDSQYKHKTMLQNYAKKKNINLPVYSSRKEGPEHEIQFIATVLVNGESFESPKAYINLNEAEHAAAQAAMLSLSLDAAHEHNSIFCKDLLEELTKKEGLKSPTYKTDKSGEANNSIFLCTVEIEGESFHGNAAKSKKQAEFNAAQKAYNSIKEAEVYALFSNTSVEYNYFKRKSNRRTNNITSSQIEFQSLKLKDGSTKSVCQPQDSDPVIEYKELAKENIEDDDPINGGNKIEEVRVEEEIPSNDSVIIPNSQYKYKMMLQNCAQRKNIEFPRYAIRKVGPPHDLQFTATVTVSGQSFESLNFYKSLKEAEHDAAQVALLSLSLDSSRENESMFCKNLLQELTQNEGLMLPTYKTVKCGQANSPTFSSIVEIEGEYFQGKAAKTKKQAEFNAAQKAYHALMERKSNRSTADFTSSTISRIEPHKFTDDSTESGLIANSVKKNEEQAKENTADENADSYLVNNRVRVYTRKPDEDFPKGIVLLPFSDDKWVAVSLEFPNEV